MKRFKRALSLTLAAAVLLAALPLSGCGRVLPGLQKIGSSIKYSFQKASSAKRWEAWRTEAEKKLPPIVPLEDLFMAPEYIDPQVSPDGKYILYRNITDQSDRIVAQEVATGRQSEVPYPEGSQGMPEFFWAQDSKHVLFMIDNMGDENYGVYSVDRETGESVRLFAKDGVNAQIVDDNQSDPNQVFLQANARDKALFDLYECDITTGDSTLVMTNPGSVNGWYINREGRLAAVEALDENGGEDILLLQNPAAGVTSFEQASWKKLIHWDYDDAGVSQFLGFSNDGRRAFVTDSTGRDTAALVEITIADGSRRVIAEDAGYDVISYWLDLEKDEVTAVRYVKDRAEWVGLDDKMKAHLAALRQVSPGDMQIASSSADDRYWLVSFESDTEALSYYFYDAQTGDTKYLFHEMPKLRQFKLSPMEPVSFQASDGLTLHGYVTFPVGLEHKNLPMVLLVHGGPWSRDLWGYNSEVQWLANRGYAVLQVNFRGSTGFGKGFELAGDREWGGKMQQDLTDAVAWAVGQGWADRGRIAIMGASYGGYAALAGAAFTPDVYACAVDMFGPSSLTTLVQSVPDYWKPTLLQTYRAIGDPAKDEAFMKSRSPLYSVDKIKIPVLIAQGGNDVRVKPQESQQIVDAMRARNLYVDYMFFPDSGHGFGTTEERTRFYRETEQFLSVYIGGRVGKAGSGSGD